MTLWLEGEVRQNTSVQSTSSVGSDGGAVERLYGIRFSRTQLGQGPVLVDLSSLKGGVKRFLEASLTGCQPFLNQRHIQGATTVGYHPLLLSLLSFAPALGIPPSIYHGFLQPCHCG